MKLLAIQSNKRKAPKIEIIKWREQQRLSNPQNDDENITICMISFIAMPRAAKKLIKGKLEKLLKIRNNGELQSNIFFTLCHQGNKHKNFPFMNFQVQKKWNTTNEKSIKIKFVIVLSLGWYGEKRKKEAHGLESWLHL